MSSSHGYIVSVDDLKRQNNEGIISDNARSILGNVSAEIKKANKQGDSTVLFDLPETFDIPNISRSDSQLVVYCRVVKELEKNGFKVNFSTQNRTVLIIKWKNEMSEEYKSELKDYLQKRCV